MRLSVPPNGAGVSIATAAIRAKIAHYLFAPQGLLVLLRVVGAGGVITSQVFLTRCLGAQAFGEYAIALAWMQVVTAIAKLGLDNAIVRFVAEYRAKDEKEKLAGFLSDSSAACVASSLIVAAGMALVTMWCWDSIGAGLGMALIVASIGVPIVALRQIAEAGLRAVGWSVCSQMSIAIWPTLLVLLTLSYSEICGDSCTSAGAVGLYLVASIVAGICVLVARACCPLSLFTSCGVARCRLEWLKTTSGFLAQELLIFARSRSNLVLAGFILGSESAGVYALMERIAEAALLGLQSIIMVITPQLSAAFARREYREVRRIMRMGQVYGISSALPVVVVFWFWGEPLLSRLGWGHEGGWALLMVLMISGVVSNGVTGPGSYILLMTGWERVNVLVTLLCGIANVCLCISLAPNMGIMGLAGAQVVTGLFWMAGIQWCLWHHPAWEHAR